MGCLTLKIKAPWCFTATATTNQSIMRNNPDDLDLQQHIKINRVFVTKLAFLWCGDVKRCKLKLESTNSKARKNLEHSTNLQEIHLCTGISWNNQVISYKFSRCYQMMYQGSLMINTISLAVTVTMIFLCDLKKKVHPNGKWWKYCIRRIISPSIVFKAWCP
jgi:hypothetical protein